MYRYTKNEPTPDSMFPFKLKEDIDLDNLATQLNVIHHLGILEDLVDYIFEDPDIDLETITILLTAQKEGILRPKNINNLKEGFYHRYCDVHFTSQLLYDCETGKELTMYDFGESWGIKEEDFE